MAQVHHYGGFNPSEDKPTNGTKPIWAVESIKEGQLLDEPTEGFYTLISGFRHQAETNPESDCLGVKSGNSYVWQSYKETYERSINFSKGLIFKNLVPEHIEDGQVWQKLGIFANNAPEWTMTSLACQANNTSIVTFYSTLGEESIAYCVNETSLITMAVDDIGAKTLLKTKKSENIDTLVNIITFSDVLPATREALRELGFAVYSFSEIENIGRDAQVELIECVPESIFLLCYTSGTTGKPKAVMQTQENFVCGFRGIEAFGIKFGVSDVHISYLPLAHLFEQYVQGIILYYGGAIGFFGGDVRKLIDDIQALNPTFVAMVPRLLNRIYDVINNKVSQGSFLKRTLFNWGMSSKVNNLVQTADPTSGFWDSLVFKKTALMLGTRVRFMISSSAPISKDNLNFLKSCFCVPIHEAYGLTEICGPTTGTHKDDPNAGHVGGVLTNNEVMLADIPEMDYTAENKPYPQGEICVRGKNVMVGYYKKPELTEEVIDEDGWFHTGDIGEMWDNGCIKIIDRKKNIFKLAQGEYIAPEKLENVYCKSPLVGQIFVYGDSLKAHLVAIVTLDEEIALPWAQENKIEDVFTDEKTKKAILDDLLQKAKEAKFNGLEKIKAIHIAKEPFSIENGLLTPTMKLMRFSAKKQFQEQIDELYA